MLELKITLIMLMAKFHFLPAPTAEPLVLETGLVLRTLNELKIKIRRRNVEEIWVIKMDFQNFVFRLPCVKLMTSYKSQNHHLILHLRYSVNILSVNKRSLPRCSIIKIAYLFSQISRWIAILQVPVGSWSRHLLNYTSSLAKLNFRYRCSL